MKQGAFLQVVGGAEAYTAACRACYHSLNSDKAQAAPLTERNRKTQTKRSALASPHCAFKRVLLPCSMSVTCSIGSQLFAAVRKTGIPN